MELYMKLIYKIFHFTFYPYIKYILKSIFCLWLWLKEQREKRRENKKKGQNLYFGDRMILLEEDSRIFLVVVIVAIIVVAVVIHSMQQCNTHEYPPCSSAIICEDYKFGVKDIIFFMIKYLTLEFNVSMLPPFKP